MNPDLRFDGEGQKEREGNNRRGIRWGIITQWKKRGEKTHYWDGTRAG